MYKRQELNEEYGKLVEAEKKAVHRRHKDYSVIDIKIDKVCKMCIRDRYYTAPLVRSLQP